MLLERTSYYPKPGNFELVLRARTKACAVRKSMGLQGGDIFIERKFPKQHRDAQENVVHWELGFSSEADQQADLDARAASADFEAVRAEMAALIDDFSRALVWRADVATGVLRHTELDGFAIVPREITFQSDGRLLAGFLYLPPGSGPFGCMVVNHGSGIAQGSSDLCRPGTAAVLMGWGLAVFMPHRRGYGNSPGAPWRDDVSAEFGTSEYDAQLATRLADESRDVIAALNHLEGLAEIDPAHIGVMGSSFGGTVTLLAAAACSRFRCAVEFAGAAMNWEKTPGLRKLMHDAAAHLTQPIFFAQAANDYSTRPTTELAAGLAGSGRTIVHRVYPGFGLTKDEGHFLFGQGAAIWGRDAHKFLDLWL